MKHLFSMLPTAGVLVGVIIALAVTHRVLDRRAAAVAGRRLPIQITMLALTAAGLLAVVLVLPVTEATRGQLLSLIGILLTASVALSSTTFLGNAMAGLMLGAIRNFRLGDFIRVEQHFGRVSERGLFHTEIQTQDRDLTMLPNLFLVTHPVTAIRSSGTIISATVSLGYDVPRTRIEAALLDAARSVELGDPFVRVLELGDFSVTYRVAGLLEDVKTLLRAQSRLHAAVIDALHAADIEIVSPAFRNLRQLSPETRMIPEQIEAVPAAESHDAPEVEIVFDKAEEAGSVEELRASLATLLERIEATGRHVKEAPDDQEKEQARLELEHLEHQRAMLERRITMLDADLKERE